MVNQFWLHQPWCSSVEVQARTTSDHSPLLLKIDSISAQPLRPFRFQHFWLQKTDFLNIVRLNWLLPADYYGPYIVAWKLKRLKGALKNWNNQVVGNLFNNLQQAEYDLQGKQDQFDSTGDSTNLMALNECQPKYLKALSDEETYWKQRAHAKWIQEGDRNTKFFYATTLQKKLSTVYFPNKG